jgi:hypothetical protein
MDRRGGGSRKVGDGLSKVDTDHPVKEALGKEGAGGGLVRC